MVSMNDESLVTTSQEEERIAHLLQVIPKGYSTVLDAGARYGYISERIAPYFDSVTALDLDAPKIEHPKITCVQGDITQLSYPDQFFDVVLCSEVLEHIPTHLLEKSCSELSRTAKHYVIIGVPYKQDTRVGRTTCTQCGKVNPPWGHVNVFDENRLLTLFPSMSIKSISFIGTTINKTNPLSTWLYGIVGNPWGTYGQIETCIYCSAQLTRPNNMGIFQKAIAKVASYLNRIQQLFMNPQPNWMHLLLERK